MYGWGRQETRCEDIAIAQKKKKGSRKFFSSPISKLNTAHQHPSGFFFVLLPGRFTMQSEPRAGNVFAAYEKSEESIWEYRLLNPDTSRPSSAPVRSLYIHVRHGKFTALPAGKHRTGKQLCMAAM